MTTIILSGTNKISNKEFTVTSILPRDNNVAYSFSVNGVDYEAIILSDGSGYAWKKNYNKFSRPMWFEKIKVK